MGALWIHDRNPKRPHVILAGGGHSGGFFYSKLVTSDDTVSYFVVYDLLKLFEDQQVDFSKVCGVVGPQTGATPLAKQIANMLEGLRFEPCFWASPAKGERGGQKIMTFSSEDLIVLRERTVLLCEDVITTGGSVELAANSAIQAGATVLPYVLAIVNRSGLKEINGRKILALINYPMKIWNQSTEECPLCAQGSEAIHPKLPIENWARLNDRY